MAQIIRTRIGTTDVERLRTAIENLMAKGVAVELESQLAVSGKLPEPGIPLNVDQPHFGPEKSEFTVSVQMDALQDLLDEAAAEQGPMCA